MSDDNTRDGSEPSLAFAGSVGEVLAKGIADIIRIATEPDWIPVTERLPVERQHVLVWRAGAPWPDRAVLHNGKWQIASRSWLYTRVTHWMPFPAPPSEGK